MAGVPGHDTQFIPAAAAAVLVRGSQKAGAPCHDSQFIAAAIPQPQSLVKGVPTAAPPCYDSQFISMAPTARWS